LCTACAQAVIVSPLMRALETAAGVFGGGPFDGRGRPLMLAQTEAEDERAAHGAVACAEGLPFIAFEGCRERLGARPGPAPPLAGCSAPARRQRVLPHVPSACRCGSAHSAGCRRRCVCAHARRWHQRALARLLQSEPGAARAGAASCDRRRDIRHAVAAFPGVDFSHIEPGADAIYHKHRVETEPAVMERGLRFLQWLMARCETLPNRRPATPAPGGAPRGRAARPPPRPARSCEGAPARAERGGDRAQPGVAHRRRDALRLPVPHAVRVRARLRAARPGAARPRRPCARAARASQGRPPLIGAAPPAPTHAAEAAAWRAQDELHRAFDNCELRSVVVTDAAGGGKVDTTWWPGGRTGL